MFLNPTGGAGAEILQTEYRSHLAEINDVSPCTSNHCYKSLIRPIVTMISNQITVSLQPRSLPPSLLVHVPCAPPTRTLFLFRFFFQLPLGLGTIKLDGLPCPANPGSVTFSLEVTLPSIAPPGDYDISISGSDPSGSSAMCLDVLLKL